MQGKRASPYRSVLVAKRQFTKGIDLVHHQMKRLQTMQLTMDESVRMMKNQATGDARELTRGQLKPKQTRGAFARGRTPAQRTPTGRRRGRAPLLPINIQSGRLHRAVKNRSFGSIQTNHRVKFEVFTRAPYAKYILSDSGTSKMVARGMKAEATKRLKARQAAHVQHFIRKQRSI